MIPPKKVISPTVEDYLTVELVASALAERIPTSVAVFNERGRTESDNGRPLKLYHYAGVKQPQKKQVSVSDSYTGIFNWHLLNRVAFDFVTTNLLPQHQEMFLNQIGRSSRDGRSKVVETCSAEDAVELISQVWDDVSTYVHSKADIVPAENMESVAAELFAYQFQVRRQKGNMFKNNLRLPRHEEVSLILHGYSLGRIKYLREYVKPTNHVPVLTYESILENDLMDYPDEWLEEIISMISDEPSVRFGNPYFV